MQLSYPYRTLSVGISWQAIAVGRYVGRYLPSAIEMFVVFRETTQG